MLPVPLTAFVRFLMESWLAWLELLLLAVLRGRSCDFQGLVAFFFSVLVLLPFSALNGPPPSLFVRSRTIRAGSPKHEALNLSVFRLGDFSIWANPPHNPRDPLDDRLESRCARTSSLKTNTQTTAATICLSHCLSVQVTCQESCC